MRCLGRSGYASTSISEIIKEAGVSRGALIHHYASKIELVADAIADFYEQRLHRFENQLLGEQNIKLCFEDRLRVLKADFEEWFFTALEAEVALRTNTKLARLVDDATGDLRESRIQIYESLFPEFQDFGSPKVLVATVACFLRGLCIESMQEDNREWIETIFQQFLQIFESYLRKGFQQSSAS